MMSLEEAKRKRPDGRLYKCEYYSVWANKRSCFFCVECQDIWFDYSHGPYMFGCEKNLDIEYGLKGKCLGFHES